MNRIYTCIVISCFLFVGNTVFAQNVEKLKLKDEFTNFFAGFKEGEAFKMSGSLGMNTRSYFALNTENRQAPFTWFLNARLNISIYKIRIPFSAMISAQNQTVSHPFTKETFENFGKKNFTRIGASPYYKWAKVHLGHRSMNFSPLTLSNHTFLGAGTELTPGKIRFATFYGGMARAEPRDLALFGLNRQVFDRRGFGLKAGYGSKQNFVDLILFTAKDQPNLIDPINRDSVRVFQNDNAVLGLNGQVTLFEKVQLKMELASSGFTKNAVDPTTGLRNSPLPGFLITPRTSTIYRQAINASLNYQLGAVNLGMGYKRVEPEYRSLGTYFFNDDLEDYTLNLGFGLFENKLRVSGNGGIQRNNIFNDKATQYNRAIGTVNVNYTLKGLNIGANFSNNSSAIDYVFNAELDSLNAVVVTQNAGLNIAYPIIAKNGNRHLLSSNFSLQEVNDDVEERSRSAASQMINTAFSYGFTPKESGWQYTVRLSYNRNELSQMLIDRYGLSVGVKRQLIADIWSLATNINYYSSQGQQVSNQTLNVSINSPIRISKRHRVNIGVRYLNRLMSLTAGQGDFQEFITTINYTYTF